MLDVIVYFILLIGSGCSATAAYLLGASVLTTVPTYDTPHATLFFTAGVVLFVLALAAWAYKLGKFKYHKPQQYVVNKPVNDYVDTAAVDHKIVPPSAIVVPKS